MQRHSVNQKARLKRLHTLQATEAIEGRQLGPKQANIQLSTLIANVGSIRKHKTPGGLVASVCEASEN